MLLLYSASSDLDFVYDFWSFLFFTTIASKSLRSLVSAMMSSMRALR